MKPMPVGLYISVPFCRTKCSYCNFASDVFSRAVFQRYVERVCADIKRAHDTAEAVGGLLERAVDSVYLGGGTPTVLDFRDLERIFVTISQTFELQSNAEITVECAPGTLTTDILDTLLNCGVNRVSLGVQSFVDVEAASVGRLHNRATVLDDIEHLRRAGISNLNVDLIAGLPHQTMATWEISVAEAIASGVPHVSVYMLEVDEDSRLGRELIAGGTRYHAHTVPDEGMTADFYEFACERLESAGIRQYEISNFAREGHVSRHNLKYWLRHSYFGFGVDAHSMLKSVSGDKSREGVRFSNSDSLDRYMAGAPPKHEPVSFAAALEETFFLGLRLRRGVSLAKVAQQFRPEAVTLHAETIADFVRDGLLRQDDDVIRLTSRGRLLSNEVFERFISASKSVV
jgi:oxygen-independent coproporphyrinogen-3 oxidase